MQLSSLVILLVAQSASAFTLSYINSRPVSSTALMGYLDDLSEELHSPDPDAIEEDDSKEATNLKQEDVDRFSVGNWDTYVEFNEFDGGDGQMGVAGDGNKSLEKFDTSQVIKSRSMSAKNAWGTSSGYADDLVEKGVDTQRAQQLENWHNQQEVLNKRKQQRWLTDEFDSSTEEQGDENWRELAKFGVERNQEFDLDEAFGSVQVGDVEGVIELTGRMHGPAAVHEFGLRNPFMGFADFRAAFTPETGDEWTVSPSEGALKQREDTQFLVKFKAQKPGVCEGYLVIETEDFKKTWKVVGSTA